ncbi:hypothetical protein BJ122_13015 [Rhodopseudomonas faecalis]|uniref:Uncharacterized protein n=1 Tax=Rhodopseudomonas faecalis TaxID=99655 RepID=A0A318T785_9BRAD|nr:hypothetical protein [Rhodopseudomonas faecalis]PYF00046.1 hypothetical protein BJ122_13015 [Rhodopseudomonas faecalis]
MLWYHHVFVLWVLAHMAWAAYVLERDWRRSRQPEPALARDQLDKVYP